MPHGCEPCAVERACNLTFAISLSLQLLSLCASGFFCAKTSRPSGPGNTRQVTVNARDEFRRCVRGCIAAVDARAQWRCRGHRRHVRTCCWRNLHTSHYRLRLCSLRCSGRLLTHAHYACKRVFGARVLTRHLLLTSIPFLDARVCAADLHSSTVRLSMSEGILKHSACLLCSTHSFRRTQRILHHAPMHLLRR
jgi:hypothetical protein